MAGSTAADRLRDLIDGLIGALDDATGVRRRQLGRRPTMLATSAINAVADLSDDARAVLPELLRDVAAAEGQAGQTARAAAVAQALDPGALGQLRDLLGTLGVRSSVTPTPTVSAFLRDTYAAERRLREDAHRHVAGYVGLFARVTGDKPLADYTRADVIRWVRVLEQLRTSYGKRKGDDLKPIAQLIKESREERTLNRTTIEKHTTHLKAFFLSGNRHFRWCSREEVEDLFREIPLSDHVPDARPRKSWTVAQLTDLLASPIWSGTRSRSEDITRRHEPGPQIHRDAYWWLPVAALWTGARLEELAQLHHDDLGRDRDGIAYLRIRADEGRKLKTEHSIRNVPVHPFLEEIGFLDLFKSKTKGRIFPDLKLHGRPPSWGALYSSHFNDYRRAAGLYEPLRDFHSFRRTFISMLRTRGKVDALTVAAIVGHDDSDPELKRVRQTNDYTDYSIAALAEAIEALDYEAAGLNVGVLRRAAAACTPRGSGRIDR